MGEKQCWEQRYRQLHPTNTSWHQDEPQPSLDWIRASANPHHAIIDIGGGASRLVNKLHAEGYRDLSALDVSGQALKYSRVCMGRAAREVDWIEADLTQHEFERQYDLWHDRAVLHFFNTKEGQQAYRQALLKALKPGGIAIIATFALDGPRRCSDLPVKRYSRNTQQKLLGEEFTLLKALNISHVTPSGKTQRFIYCHWRLARATPRG